MLFLATSSLTAICVGAGQYEALLTFQNGRLVKQQVVAYDPVLKKAREFIQEFDRKSLP